MKASYLFLLAIVLSFSSFRSPGASAAPAAPGGGSAPFLASFKASTPILPNDEIRALWVVRHALASREEIDRVVDAAVRGRFQLLFVQIRGRGDAYYRSSIEPPANELASSPEEFDPLQYILARAHGAGITVHAWVNVFYVWSDGDSSPPPGHVVSRHPEWLLVDAEGRRMDEVPIDSLRRNGAEGYFLSPYEGEVREYTASVVRDVASRYDVDGIHLDYVRFPGSFYGYGVRARTRFALRYGVDPLRLLRSREEVASIVGDDGAASLDDLFSEWRAAYVDSMVAALREASRGLPLSAAVVADPREAKRGKGQDWVRWVHEGLVDFVVLMAYNYRPDELQKKIRYVKNVIGEESFLVGLPLFGGRARYLEGSVARLREEGVIGCSLFSHEQLIDNPFSIRFVRKVFFGEE